MLSFGGSLFMAFPAANSYGIGERNRHLTFNTTVGRLRRRYLPRRTVIPIWSAIPGPAAEAPACDRTALVF